MTPICLIETPFKEKFGIPRQPLLVLEAWGRMEFEKNDFNLEAFRGIEQFSHLWLIFEFHQAKHEGAKALVRPPRFLGKEKLGIFATRSPHRPNHLGLSVVKFNKLEVTQSKIILWVDGVDLVSGTPVLDIKPYLPYVDVVREASAGLFNEPPLARPVTWLVDRPQEWQLIEKVIGLDPRPGFDQDDDFGIAIAGQNVRFRCREGKFEIFEVSESSPHHQRQR